MSHLIENTNVEIPITKSSKLTKYFIIIKSFLIFSMTSFYFSILFVFLLFNKKQKNKEQTIAYIKEFRHSQKEEYEILQYFFVFTNTSPLEYSKIGGFCMCEKVNFNVIEKNKNSNIEDIAKSIEIIVNKLIVNEFAKSVD